MKVGLRVDVDTYRGTHLGVPALCELFKKHGPRASFFFSVGPDNMGRHLWRLLRPKFLAKMLRTKAASLYGWDILLRGTLWPGPLIGARFAPIIRGTADDGHEVGLHAWDHHYWQTRIDDLDDDAISLELTRGADFLERILGNPPVASAAPAWKCNDRVLARKEALPFRYNSDCRGFSLFKPRLDAGVCNQPQIPVTLPTYDELIGSQGVTAENYNDTLLDLIKPGQLNVLTIHAEVEGIGLRDLFEDFLRKAKNKGCIFVPLGSLWQGEDLACGRLRQQELEGREGWTSVQQEAQA